MKHKKTKLAAAVLAASMCMFSAAAVATNGYFTHGVGAQSKGMAGTGIGSNANMGPIIVASNPALAVFAGDDWEVGLSIFSPRRTYVASSSLANGQGGAFTLGEGEYDSGSEWFPIPYVAKNWRLANDRALTFVFYGRGGMNTDWDDPNITATFDPDTPLGPAPVTTFPGVYGAGKAGVDFAQAFLTLNYAGKVSDKFAWGIGPVFAIQSFEALGLGAVAPFSFAPFTKTFNTGGFPSALSDNGHEIATGFGLSAGLWWGLSDAVSLGLAYQSKFSMSEFDDYADLFAEDGGFDIPSSLKFGLSFKTSDALRINFDIEHTRFGEVDSVGNPMANLVACPWLGGSDVESCLGGANGGGFGWEDMTTYKLGAEWQASQDYIWRFGYSYGEQPIQGADVLFNILAPGVMEQHFTVGLTMVRPDAGDWTFSFMFAPENSVTGPNMFDPTQTVELKMNQLEFEFGFRW